MKSRLITVCILLLLPVFSQCQNILTVNGKEVDEFYLDITWEYWLNPPSNIEFEPVRNRGITMSSVFRLDGGDNKLGIAPGIAFSSANVHTNVKDWSFNKDGEIKDVWDDPQYKKNKVVLSYLGVPIELQYRAKKEKYKTFKASLGIRGGLLVDLHTKLKQDNGEKIKHKFQGPFNSYRYGAYARVGYGRWYFYGYWGISSVFDSDNAPDTQSISAGISFSGF